MMTCSFIEVLNFIAAAVDGVFSKEVFIALAAAYIGARATREATNKAHEYAIQKTRDDEAEITKNMLRLIRTELTTAWDIYMDEYGEELLTCPDGTPYFKILPIGDNPFPIYDSAPACLANVNPITSANIVRIYMRTKGLITMININNADSQAALNAGKYAIQHQINKAISDGHIIGEEVARRLNDQRDFYICQEAKQLGMGSTSDGMKSLTNELKGILAAITVDIDEITHSPQLNR